MSRPSLYSHLLIHWTGTQHTLSTIYCLKSAILSAVTMRGANRRHEQQPEDPRSPSLLGLGLVGLVRVPAPLELAVAPLTRNRCRPLADANNACALRCRQLKQPQSLSPTETASIVVAN